MIRDNTRSFENVYKQYSSVFLYLAIVFLPLFLAFSVYPDQPPATPGNIRAYDTPNDAGSSITIEWMPSADDNGGENDVVEYVVLRADLPIIQTKPVKSISRRKNPEKYQCQDDRVERGKSYHYVVWAKDKVGNIAASQVVGPVVPRAQWLNRARIPTAVGVIILSGIVIFCIQRAKSGKLPHIRKISGLEAMDEAIGRATEMGKSVLYVSGLSGIGSIATMASMNILARVARMTAEYDASLLVPCNEPVVMNIEREVVQNAYIDADRPDTYRQENVFFIADDQFAYAAAVDGIIIREKPATIFYMGAFMAESLILAEVGNAVGAIQIAGTDSITQLPFFITACDYTLMGEELFAASAYLSKEPMLLGSLKGQDWGKILAIALILAGAALQLLGVDWFVNLFKI